MENEWRTVVYQGDTYDCLEISSYGELRNVKTKTVYKQTIGRTGYYQVCVSLGSRKKKELFKIHRCVAETFIDNPLNKPQINHIDGNKLNNQVSNLEWVTSKENCQHAYRMGLSHAKKGSDNPNAKLNNEQVSFIRKYYKPRDKNFGSRALGRMFGMDHATILEVINMITYQNVC